METQNAADAARIAAEAEAHLTTAIANAKHEGYADAGLIVDLCALSGRMDLAAGFLSEKKSADVVRKELIAAKAKGQVGTELNTSVMPGADASGKDKSFGKAKPWGEVLSALGFKK